MSLTPLIRKKVSERWPKVVDMICDKLRDALNEAVDSITEEVLDAMRESNWENIDIAITRIIAEYLEDYEAELGIDLTDVIEKVWRGEL